MKNTSEPQTKAFIIDGSGIHILRNEMPEFLIVDGTPLDVMKACPRRAIHGKIETCRSHRYDLLDENEFILDSNKRTHSIADRIILFISRTRFRCIDFLFGPICH